jgi:hypothetical protein
MVNCKKIKLFSIFASVVSVGYTLYRFLVVENKIIPSPF